jgi:hypothetical protein
MENDGNSVALKTKQKMNKKLQLIMLPNGDIPMANVVQSGSMKRSYDTMNSNTFDYNETYLTNKLRQMKIDGSSQKSNYQLPFLKNYNPVEISKNIFD